MECDRLCCWVVEYGRKHFHISVVIRFLLVFSVTLKKELAGAESRETYNKRRQERGKTIACSKYIKSEVYDIPAYLETARVR